MRDNDTIAAISTGLTNSGISIIRVSGDDAIDIVDSIYRGKINLSLADSHTIHYGHIYDDEVMIDEVLVSVYRSPHTFTGEDVVEINCHGGVYVTKRILELVISHGASMAGPGEFTKRAFLSGRIDLSQAESVMGIIESDNEYALRANASQLDGSLRREIELIREKIIYEASYIEAAIDDPEHYDTNGYSANLSEIVKTLRIRIDKLLRDSYSGILLANGISTVIVGKPNVGKSSLLNILAKKDKSIVTDIPGTTRDTIEEKISIDGIVLNIIDTAGIRDSDNVVERIGVDKSLKAIDEADLILLVIDSSIPLDGNDNRIIDAVRDKDVICLFNKSDLEPVVDADYIEGLIGTQPIEISAKEGIGIDSISDKIRDMFFGGEIDSNDEIIITSIRHRELLRAALDSLDNVAESISNNMPEDFYTIDLMDAYKSLGLIIGEEVEDDLVDEIFSKFCMGK